LLQQLERQITKHGIKANDPNVLSTKILHEQNLLINRIKSLKKLPDDIAENSALLENLFSLFVSIYSKIPIFICGKPGSSKSLAVDIITQTFKRSSSQDSYFDGFANLHQNYFQGSKQTTDTGIEKVFEDALNRKGKKNMIQMVFIDELGLAELSPHNPLKILHKYLDSTSHGNLYLIFVFSDIIKKIII
jgi:hypothetical protein